LRKGGDRPPRLKKNRITEVGRTGAANKKKATCQKDREKIEKEKRLTKKSDLGSRLKNPYRVQGKRKRLNSEKIFL